MVLVEVVCGIEDYAHIMTQLMNLLNKSSSGPEIAMPHSKRLQNSASAHLISPTQNQPMLHKESLGEGGSSQRNFAMMMMVTRYAWLLIQPVRRGTHRRQYKISATAYGMQVRREDNMHMSDTYSMRLGVTGSRKGEM